MGTARIEIASINALQAAPRARIELASVNIIFSEAAQWEVFISTPTSLEATLTYEPPGFGSIVGRWTWPMTERLGFSTEILASHDRTEQRIAKRRGVPARTVSTKVLIKGDHQYAQLEALVHGWLKRKARVPLWFDGEIHSGTLAAGSSEISIDTRYADYRAGGGVLIYSSPELYEFVYVDSFTDSALTLWGQTVYAHEGAKWVMPAKLGYCVNAGRIERHHGGALIRATWLIEDVAAVSGFTANMTYDGYTVLTDPAYLPGDHAQVFQDPDVAVLDGGSGPFAVISNSTFNEVTQSHVWHPQTKAACWWLRQFLHDIKARQSAFMVPTFRDDLTQTRQILAGSKILYVRNAGLTNNMGVNTLRTYLAFRPPDADIIVREITALEVTSAAEEKITLDAAPGQAFGPGDSLCFVDKCRMASDNFTWTWHGVGKATVSTPMVRVPA